MRAVLTGLATAMALAGGPAAAWSPAATPDAPFCTGYAETHQGVWRDAAGHPVQRFRLALNPDGSGCYAWLNAVLHWDVARPGELRRRTGFRAEGDLRVLDDPDGGAGIEVNVRTGTARFVSPSGTARGFLTSGR